MDVVQALAAGCRIDTNQDCSGSLYALLEGKYADVADKEVAVQLSIRENDPSS